MFGLLNRWLRYLRKMSEDCYTLVMLRHGESEWTKRNLFCGWYDSKLSENGKSREENMLLERKEDVQDSYVQFFTPMMPAMVKHVFINKQ